VSKLEVISTETVEVFVSEGGVSVTATAWGNHEGVDITVQEGRTVILRGSLKWEEVSLLELAIARVR
jgi:hypothetical protein